MGNCSVCGTYIASDYGKCYTCAAASHVSDDVPCQRCGMYLPRHELQMWNARMYCQYCIMDIRDEERAFEKRVQKERDERAAAPPVPERGTGREPIQHYDYGAQCQRCGKTVNTLYDFEGRRLCIECLTEEGGKPPSSPATFGSMVSAIRDIGEKGVKAVEKARAISEKISERRELDTGSGEKKGRPSFGKRAKRLLGFSVGTGSGKSESGGGGAGDGKAQSAEGAQGGAAGQQRQFDIHARTFIEKEGKIEEREVNEKADVEFDPKTRQFVEKKRPGKFAQDEKGAMLPAENADENAKNAPPPDSGQEEKAGAGSSASSGESSAQGEGQGREHPHSQFAHRKMPHDETRVIGGISKFRLLKKSKSRKEGESETGGKPEKKK